jgi:phosphohistidine swiveling domain-containing protein
MLSIGTFVIAGIGPFVSAPTMVALAGAGLGAAAGSLIGALIGTRMRKYEVRQYEEKMKGGNILIAAYTKSRLDRDHVKKIFKNAGVVTAAEAVVDHAYGRRSGAVGIAMTPTPAMPEVSDSRVS